MRKIIFLNGPPYSGKDTAAQFLTDEFGVVGPHFAREFKFSEPLKRAGQAFFDLSDTDVQFFEQRENKDTPHDKLAGLSWRQVQKTLSETWFKPLVGQDGFGIIALNRVNNSATRMAVFSDNGFEDEAWPLVKHFGINNCLNIHLIRDGCSFENDTRSYWEIPGMSTVELNNQFDLDMFGLQVVRKVELWLETQTN